MMERCGYCRYYRPFVDDHTKGICRINKTNYYPDRGTFSTNTCCSFFIHHRDEKPCLECGQVGKHLRGCRLGSLLED